ncbi:hypothetical protein AGIG_G24739 [Arapaima gigas]
MLQLCVTGAHCPLPPTPTKGQNLLWQRKQETCGQGDAAWLRYALSAGCRASALSVAPGSLLYLQKPLVKCCSRRKQFRTVTQELGHDCM